MNREQKEAWMRVARMLVPKFVCEMSRTSLLTIYFVKEAYNSTLLHIEEEFRNTLARYLTKYLIKRWRLKEKCGNIHV